MQNIKLDTRITKPFQLTLFYRIAHSRHAGCGKLSWTRIVSTSGGRVLGSRTRNKCSLRHSLPLRTWQAMSLAKLFLGSLRPCSGVRRGTQKPYSIGRHRQPDPRPDPHDPESLVPNAKGVAQSSRTAPSGWSSSTLPVLPSAPCTRSSGWSWRMCLWIISLSWQLSFPSSVKVSSKSCNIQVGKRCSEISL